MKSTYFDRNGRRRYVIEMLRSLKKYATVFFFYNLYIISLADFFTQPQHIYYEKYEPACVSVHHLEKKSS